MKTKLATLGALLLIAGCDHKSTGTNFLYEAARQTTPAIQPGGTAGVGTAPTSRAVAAVVAPWDFGNPAFEVFTMLRDFDPDRDTGTSVGLDNMYKSLHQTGAFYDEYRKRCVAITPKVITSPFPFGNAVTYDCALNDPAAKHGHASREPAGQRLGLNTWRVDYPEGHAEQGAQEVSYVDATGDLVVDEVAWVDYPVQADFSMRYHVEGNSSTHQFSVKLLKYTAGGYWISVVGHGISRGAGNHFLFKATDQGGVTGGYFCYPADLVEAQMKLISWTGAGAIDPACSGYQAAVDALTPFQGPADVPTKASDFAGSSIYLTY